MTEIECPLCGCEQFYVKDPDDEYETYEFSCPNGKIVFSSKGDELEHPEILERTETYCNRCAWHGKYQEIKNVKN